MFILLLYMYLFVCFMDPLSIYIYIHVYFDRIYLFAAMYFTLAVSLIHLYLIELLIHLLLFFVPICSMHIFIYEKKHDDFKQSAWCPVTKYQT